MPDTTIFKMFPWFTFLTVLSFPLGACIGSFLNVCIYRIPRELSIVTPRSHCPHCNTMIPWYLNIPLVSFILLRAKCRYCSQPISPRYFIVEFLTGLIFLLFWLKFDTLPGPRPFGVDPITHIELVPIYWLFASGLILGTFVDFEHMIIPDRVSLGGILLGLALSGFFPMLHGEQECMRGLLWSSLGAMTGWFTLWGVAILGRVILKKDAMGFGDVKLLGAIGAFLGTKAVICTIVISSLIGSVVGIALIMAGRKQMQSKIPYGPYLALAAIIWVLWGHVLLDAYVSFFARPQVEEPPPALPSEFFRIR